MITFKDVCTEQSDTEFYIPAGLMASMIADIKKAGIPCRAYNWKQVQARKIPNPAITDAELNEKLKKFRDAGYERTIDPRFTALIITPISAATLFEKSKLYFGSTMDPVFARYRAPVFRDGSKLAEQELKEEAAWEEYVQKYPDCADD